MKQFNYCYILIPSDSETFLLSPLYIFSLLTSGEDLTDAKHHHIFAFWGLVRTVVSQYDLCQPGEPLLTKGPCTLTAPEAPPGLSAPAHVPGSLFGYWQSLPHSCWRMLVSISLQLCPAWPCHSHLQKNVPALPQRGLLSREVSCSSKRHHSSHGCQGVSLSHISAQVLHIIQLNFCLQLKPENWGLH